MRFLVDLLAPAGDLARLVGVLPLEVFFDLDLDALLACFCFPVEEIVKFDTNKTRPKHNREAITKLITGYCVIVS